MDILLGCLFNSVWLIGSFAFGWLLLKLFAFVPLPAWLEISIVMALSFWVGLMGMATFIGRSMGENWSECRAKIKGILLVGIPTGAACIVAIICYLIVNLFSLDAEIKKSVVSAVTLVFWFTAMSISNKRLEKQTEEELRGYSFRRK